MWFPRKLLHSRFFTILFRMLISSKINSTVGQRISMNYPSLEGSSTQVQFYRHKEEQKISTCFNSSKKPVVYLSYSNIYSIIYFPF